MNGAPSLERAVAVLVSREGGVAFLPRLARARRIDLAACGEAERDRIRAVVMAAVGVARDDCGRGDRRYYRVEILYADPPDEAGVHFEVPEEEAPEPLVRLWRGEPA